jgi:small subunit ribosomal protein S1
MKNIKKTKNILGPPTLGSIVKGKIIKKEGGGFLLDLGPFGTGIIYKKELENEKQVEKLKIGEVIEAKVINLENEEGLRELSLKEVSKELFWNNLKEKKEKGEIIEVKIKGANKGGLLTEINNMVAFLPTSQLSPLHYPLIKDGNKEEILKQLTKLIGKTLKVKIFHLSPKENKIILTEKIK